jgi:hypothetical protein
MEGNKMLTLNIITGKDFDKLVDKNFIDAVDLDKLIESNCSTVLHISAIPYIFETLGDNKIMKYISSTGSVVKFAIVHDTLDYGSLTPICDVSFNLDETHNHPNCLRDISFSTQSVIVNGAIYSNNKTIKIYLGGK